MSTETTTWQGRIVTVDFETNDLTIRVEDAGRVRLGADVTVTTADEAAAARRERAVAEAVRRLVVTTNDDDPGFVHVDAGAILPTENHPRYWHYSYEGDGQWRHVNGGDVGTLMDLLHGLASYYVERAEVQA